MKHNPCIAVDAMGGDLGPLMAIEGMALFHQRCPGVSFILHGPEKNISTHLALYPSLAAVCQIAHTDEFISACTKPSAALRTLPRSSMRLTLESVEKGDAHGAVSAGNTGAYLALSKLILKTIGGVDRPAIASQIPTERGESLMLDLGGTLAASSKNLIEYALMGDIFARHVFQEPRPSIGLLNVGREDIKGNDTLQQAFSTLSRSDLNFYGFIEGHDITKGTVSVIVTDGFTGNVALKTAEGVVHMCLAALKKSLGCTLRGKIAGWMARPLLKSMKDQFDPRRYNGAIWLGLNGIAVKSHGGADAVGFAHALEMAYDMIQADIVKVIHHSMAENADPEANLQDETIVVS